MNKPNGKSVEETGVPGVLAIAARRATLTTETPAGLRDGIERALDRVTVLVQRELAGAEGYEERGSASVLRRIARIHREMYFMLDAQRLELRALERRLEAADSAEVAS